MSTGEIYIGKLIISNVLKFLFVHPLKFRGFFSHEREFELTFNSLRLISVTLNIFPGSLSGENI